MTDWIKHDVWGDGDRPPVPPDKMVEVRFHHGGTHIARADEVSWLGSHFDNSYDIVAYRVVGQEPKPDPVNSPSHYTDGGIKAIDYIKAKLGPDGFRSYCVGNALKYISRAGKKGSAKEDLSKAIWYLRRAGGE